MPCSCPQSTLQEEEGRGAEEGRIVSALRGRGRKRGKDTGKDSDDTFSLFSDFFFFTRLVTWEEGVRSRLPERNTRQYKERQGRDKLLTRRLRADRNGQRHAGGGSFFFLFFAFLFLFFSFSSLSNPKKRRRKEGEKEKKRRRKEGEKEKKRRRKEEEKEKKRKRKAGEKPEKRPRKEKRRSSSISSLIGLKF